MKIIAEVMGIRPEHVGSDAYQKLCRIWPEGGGRSFNCSLPQDDPRFLLVSERLARAGLRPWTDLFQTRQPDQYTLRLRREYDNEDLRSFSLFEPQPEVYCEGLTRDDQGRIEMDVNRLEPGEEIAATSGSWTVVSPGLKAAIERAGLRAIVFRLTALRDGQAGPIPWEGHGEPFWEITSELILPPLSPSCSLFHEDGQPFTGDPSRGCVFKDGLFETAEAAYRAPDIAGVGEFDLALTSEWIGSGPRNRGQRRLIASRRFFDFCVARGLNMSWDPVRIEPS